jgi:hypothetical protein
MPGSSWEKRARRPHVSKDGPTATEGVRQAFDTVEDINTAMMGAAAAGDAAFHSPQLVRAAAPQARNVGTLLTRSSKSLVDSGKTAVEAGKSVALDPRTYEAGTAAAEFTSSALSEGPPKSTLPSVLGAGFGYAVDVEGKADEVIDWATDQKD